MPSLLLASVRGVLGINPDKWKLLGIYPWMIVGGLRKMSCFFLDWWFFILGLDLPFERICSSTWPMFYFTNRFVLVFLFPIHTSVCILFEGSIFLLQTFLESTFANQTVCSSCAGIFYSHQLVYLCTSEDFLFTPAFVIFWSEAQLFLRVFL